MFGGAVQYTYEQTSVKTLSIRTFEAVWVLAEDEVTKGVRVWAL